VGASLKMFKKNFGHYTECHPNLQPFSG